MSKRVVGLDCETVDPLLKTSGWSWKYGQGKILCTALYYEDTDEVKVIPVLNNAYSPFDLIERQCDNKEIIPSVITFFTKETEGSKDIHKMKYVIKYLCFNCIEKLTERRPDNE